MNDKKENLQYKKYIENTLKKDKKDFCPFRKEHQMDELFAVLKKDLKVKNQKILEAGAGYGRLIHFLNEFDPQQNYIGIDYVKELVDQGKRIFAKNKNISFKTANLLNLSSKYDKLYDITIIYKTLSWLPYYEEMLKKLVKLTRHKIYLTGLFCDGDIDFITKIYREASLNRDFSYLNTYSYPKFKIYCQKIGVKKIQSKDLQLDIDLPKAKNPNKLQTYTMRSKENKKLEITGNVILHWKLIILDLE